MLRSEGAYTLNLRLDSSVGRIAHKNGHSDFAGCPFAMRQAHGLCRGWKGLDAEHAIRFPDWKGLDAEPAIRLLDRKDSIQKRAPWLCRMPDCHTTSGWPMLRTEGAYMLNLRLDSSVGRGKKVGPAEELCLANGSETQCAVTPPGDGSQGCRRSRASSAARGSLRRLRVSWAFRLRECRASSVSHPPGGECLALPSFS